MNSSPFQEAFSLAVQDHIDCRPLYRLAEDIQLDSPDEGLAFARLVEAFEAQAKEGKAIEELKENAKEWLEEAPEALREELPDYVEGLKDALEDFAGDALLNLESFGEVTKADVKQEFEKFVKSFSDVITKRAAHVRSQLDKHFAEARDLAVDLAPQDEKKK